VDGQRHRSTMRFLTSLQFRAHVIHTRTSHLIIFHITSSYQLCIVYIQALAAIEEFQNLDRDIEGSAKRWKKFVEHETPEKEKFPQEWKNKSALQKLCMMRALRPDRMTYAVKWVLIYLVIIFKKIRVAGVSFNCI